MRMVLRVCAMTITVVLALSGAACRRDPGRSPAVILVFADISCSVRDFTSYREAWSRIVPQLDGGDRLVLARIGKDTYTHFSPVLDVELPAFNAFTDNSMTYEQTLAKAKDAAAEGFEKAVSGPCSPKTAILDSLVLASKLFGSDGRRPILVLLSDMLEDSDRFNFEHIAITGTLIARTIGSDQAHNELPDLHGAQVYVAGASGRTSRQAYDVQKFWLAYIAAAHGRLDPDDYAPSLLRFRRDDRTGGQTPVGAHVGHGPEKPEARLRARDGGQGSGFNGEGS
jgi:hypothetical protein